MQNRVADPRSLILSVNSGFLIIWGIRWLLTLVKIRVNPWSGVEVSMRNQVWIFRRLIQILLFEDDFPLAA